MALVILNRSKQTFGRVLSRLTKTRRVKEALPPSSRRPLLSFPQVLYYGSESSREKARLEPGRGGREREREREDTI